MKYKLTLLQILIIGLYSCSSLKDSAKVKVKYEIRHEYHNNDHYEPSKWRKKKEKLAYTKYDRNGNEIEVGDYGEIWGFRKVVVNPDSSISVISGHGKYIKKINTVTFKSYNANNQLISEEYWRYHDNKKDYRIYRTEFIYKDGILTGEVEYDTENNISREMNYNSDKTIQIVDKKSAIYEPIVRVSGESKFTYKYDSLGRIVEEFHYFNGHFLRRTVTVYKKYLKTTYLYDDSPDKLWLFKEERYDYKTGRLIREFEKFVESETEHKRIYTYNRKGLLKKVVSYNVGLRTGKDIKMYYTNYKYEFY